MPKPIKISTPDVLRKQIRKVMQLEGPACSLNHLDVSQVTDFSGAFHDLPFTGDISKWNTSKAKNMTNMFCMCPFNGDISQWDTGSVQYFSNMFRGSEFTGDLSGWNVAQGKYFSGMFKESQFNGDISRWDVSSAVSLDSMFEASQFTGILAHWNVASVLDMEAMFDASPFNGDISAWNVAALTNAQRMFAYSAFNSDVSRWRPMEGIDVQEMFLGTPFQGDLSRWNLCTQELDNMMDPSFRGALPSIEPSAARTMAHAYAAMLGGPIPLSAYLRATPFSAPHFDIIVDSKKKPAWAKPSDYAWVKKQAKVGSALGLESRELRDHCLSVRSGATFAVSLSATELADMHCLFE